MDDLLRVINEGIFRSNFDGDIVYSNPAFGLLMGLKAVQEPTNFFSVIPLAEVPRMRSVFATVRDSGTMQKGIIKLADKKRGQDRYLDYYLVVSEYKGKPTISGKISDVTEQIHHEQNMRMVIAKEKGINQFKSNFIRITSHELRTPLAVILSNEEILQMYLKGQVPVSANIQPFELIKSSIRKVFLMTEILDQLMLYSRIENGKLEYHPENTDISKLILSISSDFYEPYLDGRSLDVKMQLSEQWWYVDRVLLRHALINVINNAFKYSAGKQAPELLIQDDNEHLFITVTDQGIGIPENEVDMVFDNFFRASNVVHISGTGIGLMVVDFAIKKHDGTISLKSSLGKGSTLTIIIPKGHHEK